MRLRLLIPLAIFLTSPALAADMIYEEPTPAPAVVAPMPTYDWGGFYIGVDGGHGWGKTDTDLYLDPKGAFGGAFVGYDYQFDDWVLGIEGDFQYANIKHEISDGDDTLRTRIGYDVQWFGSARMRAGTATGPFLPYVTGGVAFGKGDVLQNVGSIVDGIELDYKYSDKAVGYTVGAGADYAFNKRFFGRVEYQYLDFGEFHYSYDNRSQEDISVTMHTVRAGLGLKF
ncbi:outer membrane protein [Chelativorans alearense]|uniref:outer membrane protein n=1 Tax=Chelativorans alearense TaxID=2681495 RepID=UPI0013D8C5AA|nr:outer membrane protein [Chelativorans alearense]